MKNLEWQELWDAMEAEPSKWIPTTEAMYWEMLEMLPPRAQCRRSFLVGEPLRHNENGDAVHACFVEIDDKYFAKNLTLKEFQEATA